MTSKVFLNSRRWRNSGVQEEGYDAQTGRVVVKVDPQYFRPAEVEYVFFIMPLLATSHVWMQPSPR